LTKPLIALGLPHRQSPGVDHEAMLCGIRMKASLKTDDYEVAPAMTWTSLLPYTFNLLWTGAINGSRKFDYFAMLHDDITPQAGWLDVLLEELIANDADLVSAVVPIKDERGLTSTAVDSNPDQWNPRRLTMREVCRLPDTFGSEHVGGPILLNTGCWVVRLGRTWTEQVRFRQQDEIRKNADGVFEAHTIPEDWDFSRQLHSHGAKILATRKVKLHHGSPSFTNVRPWGQWESDQGYESIGIPEYAKAA
jgi:hypothetical protein